MITRILSHFKYHHEGKAPLSRKSSFRGCSIDFSDSHTSSQKVVDSFIGAIENAFESFCTLMEIDTLGIDSLRKVSVSELIELSDQIHFGQSIEDLSGLFPGIFSDPVNLEPRMLQHIQQSYLEDHVMSLFGEDFSCSHEWSTDSNYKRYVQGEVNGCAGRFFFEFSEDHQLCSWGWFCNSWKLNYLGSLFPTHVLRDLRNEIETNFAARYRQVENSTAEPITKWVKPDQTLIILQTLVSYHDQPGVGSADPNSLIRVIFYKPL